MGKRSPHARIFAADRLYLDYVGRDTLYGSVRTVVWEGRAGDHSPYPDRRSQTHLVVQNLSHAVRHAQLGSVNRPPLFVGDYQLGNPTSRTCWPRPDFRLPTEYRLIDASMSGRLEMNFG